MKKKILAYALSALTCGLFTSCSDWLDINHDPNTAEKVDPGYLFNYVAVNWAGTRTGGDFYIPLSMSSQCQVDGGRLTNIKHYCSVYQWIKIKFATTSNREVTATNFYRYIAANG